MKYVLKERAACALPATDMAIPFCAADEIADWNQVMLAANLTPPVTPAPVRTRVAAIMHHAMRNGRA